MLALRSTASLHLTIAITIAGKFLLEDLPVVSCGSNLATTILLSFTPVMVTGKDYLR